MHHNQLSLRISGMRILPIKFCCLILLLNFLLINKLNAQQFKNEEELRKEAARLFEEEEFTKAYSLYAQLVSNYPKDADLNYHLGVCMLYSEPDKKKCYSYLKLAATHPQDAPKDAIFYLGKAYHINYQFDEALKYYNDYKKIGSASQIKRLQVDREIAACVNGKRLLATMSELVVINKKQLNESDYFRSYDLSTIGGKLIVKPEDFKSGYDKRKKDKSVVYIPKVGDKVYFSSYGDNGDNGRDIYYKTRQPDGSFSKSQKIPGINTEYDEDYPFLHPDGKTLYFSSKGYNSMGGYDIFKSVYNDETNSWSTPVNMEFPINSPDDDYLFVTDEAGKIAYFSTGRQSPPGKIDVLKVNTERKPMSIAVVKGTVLKESAAQRLDSKITVKNMDNGQVVGAYYAKDNGDYYMELPNGGKFIFTVETPDIPTQSDKVVLPMATSLSPFKQAISYDNKVLKILNYFDAPPEDSNYLKYIELIEKKAKLEVNEADILNNPVVNAITTNSTNPNAVKTNNPTVVSENSGNDPKTNTNSNSTSEPNVTATNTTAPKGNMTNEQLLNIAKEDAKEAIVEAQKTKQDAWDAKEIGEAKKIEANKLQKEADDALASANAITDDTKKKDALEKATEIKNNADNASKTASTILDLAKDLEADAANKQKEADLNAQYVKELETIAKNKNNKEAVAKADEIQKQLDDLSKKQKQSDNTFNTIKSSLDQKQTEITKAEEKSNAIKNDITEINKEISINQTEISNTKDKSLKKNLEGQNEELKKDLAKKNDDLAANEKIIARLKNESGAIQNQIDIVNTVKTTDSKTPIAANTNTTAPSADNSNPLTSEGVINKYKDKVQPIQNSSDKKEYANANKILEDFNKEITDVIALERVDLKAAGDNNEKQKIISEINKLEKQKKENETRITANNEKIKQLESGTTIAANTNTTSTTSGNQITNTTSTPASTYQPVDVNFNGSNDAGKLTALKNDISANNNPAFDYNNYKDPNSSTLKKDAETKLQQVNTTKNELQNAITKAEDAMKSGGAPVSSANTQKDKLNSDGDVLSNQAKDLRTQAQTKTGTEKDKLLNDARDLDKQANKKYLEATDVTKTQNTAEFDTNNQNVKDLIAVNKSEQADIDQATKLNNEANTAFKQAKAIRVEANSYGNDAAKLGTISNAEEKEAEALAKQNKAIELLMKANTGFALKKAETSGGADNTAVLNDVKQLYDKLNSEKIEAYMALSKANQNEFTQQNEKVKPTSSQGTELKKQADDLNKQALSLISKAITEPNPGAKQNLLSEANKKETEALSVLNKAAEEQPVAANTNTTSAVVTETPTAVNTNTTNAVPTNTTAATNTKTTTTAATNTPSATNTKTTNAVSTNTPANTNTTSAAVTETPVAANTNTGTARTNTNPAVNTDTQSPVANINSSTTYTALKDTSLKNMIGFLDKNQIALKNTEANNLKNTSINNLKTLADEQIKVEDEINNSPVVQVSPADVKTQVDNLLNQSDDFTSQASNLRKEAAGKQDPEKTDLINKAKDLESRSMNTKFQASELQKQINDAQYDAYNDAIANYLQKAKDKNAPELVNAQELINAINNNKKQANDIRKEADASGSNAVKLGVISNAEEKEAEILLRQMDVINMLKQYDNTYAVKTPVINSKMDANSNPQLKQKYESVNQKQSAELENIVKAYTMEYESSFAALPTNLNVNQQQAKADAEFLIGESKKLSEQASVNSDPKQKRDLLAQAAKKGQQAVINLNKIVVPANVAANNLRNNANTNGGNNNTNTNPRTNNTNTNNSGNDPNNTNVAANNNPNRNNANTNAGNNANTNANPNRNNNPGNNTNNNPATETNAPNTNTIAFKANGVEVKTNNAYTANNPIPIDQKIPDGLVFRVQIGAFKAPIPNNSFRGLTPVNGQTTPNGYIRYTAGNFDKYEDANGVKNDLKKLGYNDAFVVVYYNGQRITLNEAINIMQKDGKEINLSPNVSAGITENTNIPKNPFVAPVNTNPIVANTEPVVVTKELEKINGLLFTVQIGVYSKEVKRGQLYNLNPIYTEKLPSGLYRYTAGIYNIGDKVKSDRAKVNELGIKDAFVSAYYNGKRVPFADGEKLKADSVNLKMEPENPIVFPGGGTTVVTPANNTPAGTATTTSVTPFSNGVTNGPAPTAENGVKIGEEGISFKVQIGAYRSQVPADIAANFQKIQIWPVENKLINALYIYTVGNFTDAKFAKQLRDQMVALGITDAFVSVYQNGKKLYGAEAAPYLNR